MQWLFEAKKRYGLEILNYVATSNHTHLIVHDKNGGETISRSIQLLAGRTGQEYNQRKKRKGAYWEDRYHATAIETGEHLLRCLIYVDLNMVRAGVVSHPEQWAHGGYNEIQRPRRKNILINYEALCNLSGFNNFGDFQSAHRRWVRSTLSDGKPIKQARWANAIGIGSETFVQTLRRQMGAMAIGRRVQKKTDDFELRESESAYNAIFDAKKGDIDDKNLQFWQ